jgi:hypothetical protein
MVTASVLNSEKPMAQEPSWNQKTDEEKLDFLKLWAEDLQARIGGLNDTLQLVLSKLHPVEGPSTGVPGARRQAIEAGPLSAGRASRH